tara:strand:+ start:488 stop:892 length:405 start_codon:yes stop_codon:yes gene_type:complete
MALGTHVNAFGPLSSDDVVKATADFTADSTTNAFTLPIEAVLGHDLSVVVAVPTNPTGTSPTLAVVLTSTASNNKISVSNTDLIAAKGNYVIPIPPVRSSTWNVSLTIGGSSTPTFANLTVYVAKAGHAVLPVT